MIHGYHATFGTYGFYVPNDPRGSKSKFVGGRKLYETAGRVTPGADKRFDQLTNDQRETLAYTRSVLKRPPVVIDEMQIAIIAAAIGLQSRLRRLNIWALAIMPCHVHLVFARCGQRAESVVDELKLDVTAAFRDAIRLPPGCDPDNSPWADGRWIKFLDSEHAIENAIEYTIENPVRDGSPRQDWPLVTPFRGLDPGLVSYGD